jgi:hypothetical protein
VDKNTGYRMILLEGKGKYTTEQKIIMENHIGRKLHSYEVVHHKNCNKLDNRLDNLLLTTRVEHPKIHKLMGKEE